MIFIFKRWWLINMSLMWACHVCSSKTKQRNKSALCTWEFWHLFISDHSIALHLQRQLALNLKQREWGFLSTETEEELSATGRWTVLSLPNGDTPPGWSVCWARGKRYCDRCQLLSMYQAQALERRFVSLDSKKFSVKLNLKKLLMKEG